MVHTCNGPKSYRKLVACVKVVPCKPALIETHPMTCTFYLVILCQLHMVIPENIAMLPLLSFKMLYPNVL